LRQQEGVGQRFTVGFMFHKTLHNGRLAFRADLPTTIDPRADAHMDMVSARLAMMPIRR
jgi:hypothetical protein